MKPNNRLVCSKVVAPITAFATQANRFPSLGLRLQGIFHCLDRIQSIQGLRRAQPGERSPRGCNKAFNAQGNRKQRLTLKGKGHLSGLLVLPLLIIASSLSANSLVGIDFPPMEGNQLKLALTFSSEVSAPQIQDNASPARILLKFEGVTNQLAQTNYPLTDDNFINVQALSGHSQTFVVVHLKELRDYQVKLQKQQLFLILHPTPKYPDNEADSNRPTPVPTYLEQPYDKPISINFQDIGIRSALQILANLIDVNLVISDSIKGNISLHLKSVPWKQALDTILSSKGLVKTWQGQGQGQVLVVNSSKELAQQRAHHPQKTQLFSIRNASALQINQLLKESGLLSKKGHLAVDNRTNTLIISETDLALKKIQAIIKAIDIPIRQVAIEARIVVVNTNFSRQMGVRWGFQQLLPTKVQINGSREAIITDSSNAEVSSNGLAVDLAANNPSGSISVGFLNDIRLLDLELSAMESSGQGEVISTPKVITGDKQKASIRSGQEFAFFNRNNDGLTTSTSFKQAVLALNVTPQITPNDQIVLELDISQDALSGFNNGIPIIDVTNLKTSVTVNNRNTLVLGGVYHTNRSGEVGKVPVLGDIPILGALFQRRLKTKQKQEILIFITPTILDGQQLIAANNPVENSPSSSLNPVSDNKKVGIPIARSTKIQAVPINKSSNQKELLDGL